MTDDPETERSGSHKGRIPLEKAIRIAEAAQDKLFACSQAVLIVGSVRRQAPVVGDVDLLVLPKDVHKTISKLTEHDFVGTDRRRHKMVNGVWVEIHLAHDEREMGALMLHTIGDKAFNVELRKIAQKEGWKLSPYGLFGRNGKTILQSPDERDFFDALGVPWRPPEERSTTHSMGAYVHPENRPDPSSPETLYPGASWRLEPFKKPHHEDEGKVIWYGAQGKEGRYGSRIIFREGGWEFTEYTGTERMKNPQAPIMATTVFVSYQDLIAAALEKYGVEVPLDALETNPDFWAPYAAGLGLVKMYYEGGDVRWVDRLP